MIIGNDETITIFSV